MKAFVALVLLMSFGLAQAADILVIDRKVDGHRTAKARFEISPTGVVQVSLRWKVGERGGKRTKMVQTPVTGLYAAQDGHIYFQSSRGTMDCGTIGQGERRLELVPTGSCQLIVMKSSQFLKNDHYQVYLRTP